MRHLKHGSSVFLVRREIGVEIWTLGEGKLETVREGEGKLGTEIETDILVCL